MPVPSVRRAFAAGAVALALLSPAAPAARAAAGDDSFYVPPDPLPAGAPGTVIRSRPASAGPPTARSLATAWQVMYLSTDAQGHPDAVTGTVLVPRAGDPASMPLVSFAPGTQGPAFRCASSAQIDGGYFYEQPAVNDMLAAGWAVAVTDYVGYRPGPATTYMTGRSMGPAVIDAVRAARNLPAAGLSAAAPVAFRGYSQGGGAALWAGQLQPSYAPELKLAGVVAGGVPANLGSVALGLNGKGAFGFMAYALLGLDNAYHLDLGSFLNADGQRLFGGMPQTDCALELLTSYQGDRLSQFTTSSPLSTSPWLTAVQDNRLGGTPVQAPVFQYHAANDEIVGLGQDQTLNQEYCALGMTVTWKTYDTEHLGGVYLGNADARQWLADRFAGTPATSTCPAT